MICNRKKCYIFPDSTKCKQGACVLRTPDNIGKIIRNLRGCTHLLCLLKIILYLFVIMVFYNTGTKIR